MAGELVEFDAEQLREKYGVEWVPLDSTEWSRHSAQLTALAGGNSAAITDLLTPPARPFLKEPPTSAQREAIDAGETIALAAVSVAQQDEIARVPIQENREPLVCLRELDEAHSLGWDFSEKGFHPACGDWAGKPRVFRVRAGLAERLRAMTKRLYRINLSLFFEDAFRPVGVQEGLLKRRLNWVKEQHPDWNTDQIITEVRSKTAVTPRLASHKSGAAVDVRLRSEETGEFLDIGHAYAEGGALVQLDSPFVTQQQWQNRQLLYAVARLESVAMYPGEDWHLSYGDNLAGWVYQHTQPAPYGPIKSYDETTGEIGETYQPDELDELLESLD